MNKRIRIFLGGYVNLSNAQNLNCLALAKYLNKEEFECSVMTLYSGNLLIDSSLDGIKKIHCRRPARFWKYVTYLRGLLWCDIAYLPKGEIWGFCKFWLKLLGKKSFTTVEGVISGTNLDKALAILGTERKIVKSYSYTDRTYSITKYMAAENEKLLGLRSDGVLYLGIDINQFKAVPRHKEKLQNIAFIGNNIRYKGIDDYYVLANKFPEITFHIVGGGMGYDVATEIQNRHLTNCIYHGLMDHEQLSNFLLNIDVHIFPSRSEGFPKVTLETAAMGVPSIVYGDYGANEWITTGKDGYVVNSVDEVEAIIRDLLEHPQKIDALSSEAIALAKSFDWKVVIKDWETIILNLV